MWHMHVHVCIPQKKPWGLISFLSHAESFRDSLNVSHAACCRQPRLDSHSGCLWRCLWWWLGHGLYFARAEGIRSRSARHPSPGGIWVVSCWIWFLSLWHVLTFLKVQDTLENIGMIVLAGAVLSLGGRQATILTAAIYFDDRTNPTCFIILRRSRKYQYVPHKAVAEVSKIGNL